MYYCVLKMKSAIALGSILSLGLHTGQGAALPVHESSQVCHFEERSILSRSASTHSSPVKRQSTWDPPADLVTPLNEVSFAHASFAIFAS